MTPPTDPDDTHNDPGISTPNSDGSVSWRPTLPTDEGRSDDYNLYDDDLEDLDALAIAEEAAVTDEARAGEPRRTPKDALAAAIRRSIVTGQETPGEMAERIVADPEWAAAAPSLDVEALRERLRGIFDDHDLWTLIAEEFQRLDPAFQATLPTADDVRGILSEKAP